MAQDPWEEVVAKLSAQIYTTLVQFFAVFSRFEWTLGQEGKIIHLRH